MPSTPIPTDLCTCGHPRKDHWLPPAGPGTQLHNFTLAANPNWPQPTPAAVALCLANALVHLDTAWLLVRQDQTGELEQRHIHIARANIQDALAKLDPAGRVNV